jgi:hypothetical protein
MTSGTTAQACFASARIARLFSSPTASFTRKLHSWEHIYNPLRFHQAGGNLTAIEFLERWKFITKIRLASC